jgi:hypothetical protein
MWWFCTRTSWWTMVESREPEESTWRFQDRAPTRPVCPPMERTIFCAPTSHSWVSALAVPMARCEPVSWIHETDVM